MTKVASGCSRGLLGLLNVALLIASLVMIGLLLWIRFDPNFEAEIRKDLKITENIQQLDNYKRLINTGLTVSFWVLLGFGIAGAVIGLIGAVGAVFGINCLIGFHFCLLLIMALLEIAVGIYILVTRDTLRQTVQGYVIAAYNARTLDYDSIRMRYDCCGIDGVPDLACLTGQPTCTGSVWDRLDFTLMVAGFVLIGILICQFISCLCSVTALCIKRNAELTEIGERVHEQMWTTAETMRRRAVAAGDSVLKLGDKVRVAGDRLRDVSEPAYLDLKDYVTAACEDSKPFEELVEDDRHTLIEMYLGTSVLLIGLSLGELAGTSSLLVPVMDYLFSPYATFAMLVLLPARFALLLKKTAMDDTERRTSIFMLSFLLGLLGSFTFGGARLLALAPSLLFLTPTVLALTIDNQIVSVPKGFDRHKILMGAATFSLVISTVLAYFPLGHLHKTTLLYFGAHAAFLFVHAQVCSARLKEKSLCQGVGQLLYVVGVFALQLLLSAFSG